VSLHDGDFHDAVSPQLNGTPTERPYDPSDSRALRRPPIGISLWSSTGGFSHLDNPACQAESGFLSFGSNTVQTNSELFTAT
jgi:hypothetical protein